MKKKSWNALDMIVYQDDDYIVINKPPYLSTLEDRNDPENVLALFRAIEPAIQVCHRLDKETSGALLLARNEDAYRMVAIQFQERNVEKVYHALVKGRFMNEVIKVDIPLRITGSGRAKPDKRLGKETVTLFRPKEYFNKYTLVEAKPITGRTHQIRAHLGHLNYPICGDEFYGGTPVLLSGIKKNYKPKAEMIERPLMSRVALHSSSISINLSKQNNISQSCEYPNDIASLLKKIRKFE